MDKIIDSHLNLSSLEHGIIKYDYVNKVVYFDTKFTKFFKLPKSMVNGVQLDDKTVQKNSELVNLLKVVKKIKSEKIFRKFEYNTGDKSELLFIKRIVQYDDEYIFAYFISPEFSEFSSDYEINRNVINLLADSSSTTYWWIDFSKEKNRYFSSSHLYGTSGEVVEDVNSTFYEYLDSAAAENEEFKALAELARKTIKETVEGRRNSYHISHPIKVDEQIYWIDTTARITSRDKVGRPRLLVGIDTVTNESNTDVEAELIRQVVDIGLNKSDIGIWIMTIRNGTKHFRYNEKLRELYNFESGTGTNVSDPLVYDNKFQIAKKRVLDKYPEFKTFFDDDLSAFTRVINREIDSYKSILPFINKDDKVVWLEFRSSVVSTDIDGNVTAITGAAIEVTDLLEDELYLRLFGNIKTKINKANKQAIEMVDLIIWSVDYKTHPKGDIFYGNATYVEKFGLKKQKNGLIKIADYFSTILTSDDYTLSKEELDEITFKIKSGELEGFNNIILKHKNLKTGEQIYCSHTSKVTERTSDGKVLYLSGYVEDVTAEINARIESDTLSESVTEYKQFNKLAVKAGKLMVFNMNYLNEKKGKEIYANDYFLKALEMPRNRNHFSMEDYVNTICDDEEGKRLFTEVELQYMEVLKGQRNFVNNKLTKHLSKKTGKILYLEHNSQVQERRSDGRVISIGGFLKDVTHNIQIERRIEYMAEMDLLTDVYNRNKFDIDVSLLNKNEFSIIMFDIDGLKLANDIYGHKSGDNILKHFAKCLKEEFSGNSTYRIGGDEFCVITHIIDDSVIAKMIDKVSVEVSTINSDSNYQAGVSVGYEIVEDGDFQSAFTKAENQMYRQKLSSRSSRKSKTLDTLMVALSEKTEETNEHCERISDCTAKVYQKLGYNRASEVYDISLAGKLHDIGKITVPLEILNKPSKLTTEEFNLVKKHSEAGYKIVFNLMSSDIIAEGVLYHHEHYDGSGYPYGLIGKEIPLYARIISVSDAFDAMTSNRPYSPEISVAAAVDELISHKSTQFDPEVVDAIIEVLKEEELLDK